MVKIANREFGRLFKSFRLRSEIDSLTELGLLLHDEGVIYERSILTHWQNGTRMPASRNIVLGIARLFIKRGGIKAIGEVNALLASLGMSPIDIHDLDEEPFIKWLGAPFNVPMDIENFTGREDIVMSIVWRLNKGLPALINGPAGAGKTTLAIRIAHETRNYYTDGILWYAYNIRGAEGIFLEIADTFGLDLSKAVSLDKKAKIIGELLSKRKLLLILDDIQSETDLKYFFPGGRPICSILMTSRLVNISKIDNLNIITLSGYTELEYIQYVIKKLGKEYYKAHEKQLNVLGYKVAYSPLLLTVLFSQISEDRRELSAVLETIENKELKINYGKDILKKTLDYSLKQLPQKMKDVFLSLGIFTGPDFSIRAVAEMHDLTLDEVVAACNFLDQRSLVEKSKPGRYRLHPLVKIYLKEQEKPQIWYHRLAHYYVKFIGNKELGNKYDYDAVENELENITAIYEFCYKNKDFKNLLSMWKFLGAFFWDTGRWRELRELGQVLPSPIQKNSNLPIYVSVIILAIYYMIGIYYQFNKQNELVRDIFSYTYCIEALIGGSYGMILANKWGNLRTTISNAIFWFSLGLIMQVFGQISYGILRYKYGNLIYPSVGDIGYFSSIVFYLFGIIFFNKAAGVNITARIKKHLYISICLPLLILSITYMVFLHGYDTKDLSVIRIFLDLGYPFVQSISIAISLLALFNSWSIPIPIMKTRLWLFLVGIFVQYFADFTFLYKAKLGNVSDGEFFEFLYLLSYLLITLAILQFRTFYSGEETKKLPAVS